MIRTISYEPSTHMASVGDKKFTVRNMIPVFSDEEKRCEAKQKIENALYSIFKKYNA